MNAHENGAVLDEEQLLFLTGEQLPPHFTIFLANLSSDDPIYDEAGDINMIDILSLRLQRSFDTFVDLWTEYHEVHEMQSDVQHNTTLRCEPYNANDVTALIEQNECVRVELEEVKQHYKELFESIHITRPSTNEKTSSLLTQNEDLKAQLEGNLKVAARNSVKTKVLAPGKKFTSGKLNCGYQWRPTGNKFALGELCPLTRIPVTCTAILANQQDPNTNWGSEIPKLSKIAVFKPRSQCLKMLEHSSSSTRSSLSKSFNKISQTSVSQCHKGVSLASLQATFLKRERAFTTSANVPSIYIQLFWNTLTHDAKTGVYSFQVDEHWLTLSADLLRKALNVTPADSAHPFESLLLDHLKMEMEMEIPSVKASANSDIIFFFTSAQDGNKLLDDERLSLADDLKKAHDQNQNKSK
ncbi:hypothetical protein Tco_0890769 [Tanacetum coccineum]|uniref:Uncharacterized protein n=1 Tax=Tanacetum coccineum TaxID=301880 RepID=A0ABQ5C4B7_9ASTR